MSSSFHCYKQHRRLDAVYYYIRSLTASNPFLSAKESLAALFDETSKKVLTLNLTTIFTVVSVAKLIVYNSG